jgi:hypothetical protein
MRLSLLQPLLVDVGRSMAILGAPIATIHQTATAGVLLMFCYHLWLHVCVLSGPIAI